MDILNSDKGSWSLNRISSPPLSLKLYYIVKYLGLLYSGFLIGHLEKKKNDFITMATAHHATFAHPYYIFPR